ncbi:hypothetical protein [Nocardia carnea]|uniref:hypothetical protein n=1 Tax=Nocardia carnea TaxID=37328 RepID=UPI002458A360|nr:hypothetical protein [Nocardia carnea]
MRISSWAGRRSAPRYRIGLCVVAAAALATSVTVVLTGEPDAGATANVVVCQAGLDGPHEHTMEMPRQAADALVVTTKSYFGPCARYGESKPLGKGALTAFSQTAADGTPLVIGVAATDGVFDALPYDPPTDEQYCYDKNGDGTVAHHGECAGGYEHIMALHPDVAGREDIPFTYAMVNWNPHGHIPAGVWDSPHFDLHFYLNDNADRLGIRPGPCLQLTHCDDYPLGKLLPAAQYRHPDYVDLDAVEPAMGNHLIDSTTPELHGGPFTHTFIYGSWNNEITFYEPMVNLDVFTGMRSGAAGDFCVDLKLPQAWQKPGFYPTQWCMRHRDNRAETLVTLENFVYRTAA